MKLATVSVLLLFLFGNPCLGQYTYNNRNYADDLHISTNTKFSGKIGFKGIGNEIRIFEKHDSVKPYLVIKTVDLGKLTINRIDTISDTSVTFHYGNMVVSEVYDIIIGYQQLLIFNRVTHQHKTIHNKRMIFKDGFINHDTLYLYHIDNFHPANGPAGLHLASYNLKNDKLNDTIVDFDALSFSGLNVVTGVFHQNHLWVVSPISGMLYKYNGSLNLVDSQRIPISWTNPQKNATFHYAMENEIRRDRRQMENEFQKTGKYPTSNIHNGSFFHDLKKQLTDSCEYIEQLFPYNDSLILLSVYRPSYQEMFRDLICYNPTKNQVVRKSEEWPCEMKLELSRLEDYFTVNLSISPPYTPYFVADRIYYPTFANLYLYNGEKERDTMLMKVLNDGKKNGHTWRFMEYKLN